MNTLKSFLKYSISLAVGGILLYYAFRNIDLSEFVGRIAEVDYGWVLLSIFLALISHWLRAYRWNMMLEPFGYKLNANRTFLAVMIGYLANIAFPRLGEVTRCGVLKKTDDVNASISFGTVVTERLIDFLILLALILLDFVIEFDVVFDFFAETLGLKALSLHPAWIITLATLIIVGIIIAFLAFRKIIEKEHKQPIVEKIRIFLNDMIEGFLSLRKVRSAPLFILLTLGIWVLYYLMGYVLVFALPETTHLGLAAALTILVTGGIAMSAPVQAGMGTYHTFVSAVLILYGVAGDVGLFFATLMHATQIVFILVFGGASVLFSVFITKKKSST